MFCFFRKLGFVTRINLFKAFCSNMDVSCGRLMTVGLLMALRRVINVPYNCHSCFLPLLSDALPIFDELCKRSFRFSLSCVFRGSPLVRAVAHHALKIARYDSVIGSNALFCCARYGWTAADLLAGKIDVSNSYFFKYLIIQLVDRRSVLLGLYLTFCVFGKRSFISP